MMLQIYLNNYGILVIFTVDDQLVVLLTLALKPTLLLASIYKVITSRAGKRVERKHCRLNLKMQTDT